MRHSLFRVFSALLLAWALPARAAESAPDEPPLIESGGRFWELSSTAGDRLFRIRSVIDVHYYDPGWNVLWISWDGAGCYLSPGTKPLPIRSGQRIELAGYAQPGRQLILWDRTTIRVLGEAPKDAALLLPDVIDDPNAFNLRVVDAEGLVTEQIELDKGHHRLVLISRGWTATVQLLADERQPVPQWRDGFVRVRGVFTVKYDTAQTTPAYEIWAPRLEEVAVRGWLRDDPRFDAPRTAIDALHGAPDTTLVRIAGTVRGQEPGVSVTLWDETGQARVLTRQTFPLAPGRRVEAIGYPFVAGVELQLRDGLYREIAEGPLDGSGRGSGSSALGRLRLTEQVRRLDPAEAARGYPVELRGVVTWSDPASRTFFLQDGSGGVKVTLPADGSVAPPEFATDLILTGQTEPGEFVPNVRAVWATRGIGITLPMAQSVSFEQAMTGAHYAEWVEVRGYVRSVAPERNGLSRVEVTTPAGELVARVRDLPAEHGLNGALVHVRGVCDVRVNDRRQLTSARLWVPSPEFVRVHERAPTDLFTTPLRSIGSLLQFGAARDLNHRVQISGRVALHRPGELVYLEDGHDRLLVLSRQTEPLAPGDRVNAVGFPGYAGGRLIMRDAVYRRTGSGPAPEPLVIIEPNGPELQLDGATVQMVARSLDQTTTTRNTRLQLQSGKVIFEAHSPGELAEPILPGSVVEVTGVYRVELDEYRQPRAFTLHLRTPGEIRVLRRPPWWTAAHVLWTGAGLLVVVAITTGWAVSLSRKNQQLRSAERKLHDANTDLEARVASRTRELQLEVAKRQSSEEVLAQERKLLRTLIDNVPVYLYVKNALGRFVIGNLPHARLLGAESALEVVGKTDFDIYPPELAQRYHDDDQRVLQNGDSLLQLEEPSRVNGETRWFSTTKVPLRDRRGEITGLIGVSQDITERKQAEAEREQLNRQLLESSRRAGMAEVATGILHNVGNVLNSVNVSATLAVEHIRESKVVNVAKLAELLQSHAHDLPAFFQNDLRGAKVPEFLTSLAGELTVEQARVIAELDHLWKKVEHIKDIVSMQQGYAKVSGVAEVLDLTVVVEDAVRMNASSLSRHDIEVVRAYTAQPVANTERHKVVQILVNLIHNAKQACDASGRTDKRIVLEVTQQHDRARIAVIDNGIGIAPENLTRIFGHGFTTKKDGHGFGLHSGSLTARELGGSLSVTSAGLGQGATFTLEIPLSRIPEAVPV